MSHPPAQKQKIISKKHKVRLQQEQQRRKMLLIAAGVLFALILIVLIYGVVDQTYLKMRKPVAKVGNATIQSEDFIKMVKLERQQMNAQAFQYESYKQVFAFDEQNSAYFDSLIQQIQSQMAIPESVGGTVIQKMIEQQVIKFYAEENGITASDQEIQEAIERDFAYYPNGTPTPESTVTPYSTSTLNPTQLAIVTATATSAPTEEAAEENSSATEVVDENEEEAGEEPVATGTAMPSPTAYTEDLFQENYQSFVENFSNIGLDENDILDLYRTQIISQKVYDLITADTPTEEEQLWARHILVATLEEAQIVIERLADGEDFALVAAEVSTDTSNKDIGGDLGWFGRNKMVSEFEIAAFELNVGEISEPIETTFGFHVIQLLGRETRPIDSSTLQQTKDTVFSEWLTVEKEKYTIEQYDDVWTSIVPNTPAFGEQ